MYVIYINVFVSQEPYEGDTVPSRYRGGNEAQRGAHSFGVAELGLSLRWLGPLPHRHYSTYPASHERGHFLDGNPSPQHGAMRCPRRVTAPGAPPGGSCPRRLTTLIPFFWNNRSPSTCPRTESRIIFKTTLGPPGGASCGLLLTLGDTRPSLRPPVSAN